MTACEAKTMLNLSDLVEISQIEVCVRLALELGEFSPSMDAKIRQLIATGYVSNRDQTVLAILQDAIADGCVRPIQA